MNTVKTMIITALAGTVLLASAAVALAQTPTPTATSTPTPTETPVSTATPNPTPSPTPTATPTPTLTPTPTPTATPAPTATPKPAPTKAFPGLLPRVAQILGIDEQKLRDAFAQAKREQHLALIDKWIERQIEELIARETDRAYVIQQLDKAVQEGRITAEQKAQILERWEKGGKQAPRPFGKQGRIQKR